MAAKWLCEAGLNVTLIEAGDITTPDNLHTTPNGKGNVAQFSPASPSILARQPIQARSYACREPSQRWFVDDIEVPYLQDRPYTWIRMRGLGGRVLGWEGHCYRMGDLDFKAQQHDGVGSNWPICYADLERYYSYLEQYWSVSGQNVSLPQIPNGIFISPEEPNATLDVLKGPIARRWNRAVTPARLANQSCSSEMVCKPYTGGVSTPRGDVTISTFWLPIADAIRTRRLFLIPKSIVSHVSISGDTASRVNYIDIESGQAYDLKSRIIVLCASTLESTRVLLSSHSFNQSGVLGHYLMDHLISGGASGFVPGKWDYKPGGFQQHRVYIPRFRNTDVPVTNGFIRGYGFQGRSFAFAEKELITGQTNDSGIIQHVNLTGFCESLARFENRVELLNDNCDAHGLATLRINASWCRNDVALARDACEEAVLMLEASGLQDIRRHENFSIPGACIHEVGTARMGTDYRTSVVNSFCQSHDVRNVFVTDGACWVSSGCQNPTLTMAAITLRTCDYIINMIKKDNL
jgi:choline dehydrogenase-like flavoprotein